MDRETDKQSPCLDILFVLTYLKYYQTLTTYMYKV